MAWNPSANDPPSQDVVELAAKYRPSSVLDVGCGTGRNLTPFDRPGCILVGIDTDRAAVAAARTRFHETHAEASFFTVADLRSYRPDSLFSVVLCYGVLHFLTSTERTTAYDRLRSWLEPGGLISLVMFTAREPIPVDLQGLMPEPAIDDSEIIEAFADWETVRFRSYVYHDTHCGGTLHHKHAVVRLCAQKPF